MSSAVRKQAPRPARPAARYWKGKAPKGVDVAALSDSDEEEEQNELQEEGDVSMAGDQLVQGEDEEEDMQMRAVAQKAAAKTMNVTLKDVNISKDGKVIVAGREESGRTLEEEEDQTRRSPGNIREPIPPLTRSAFDSTSQSSEYESESEEEEKPKLQFRPVFVPKRSRVTIAEREAIAEDTEEAIRRKEEEAAERKKESHDLVAESIKRELAEKQKEEEVPDVDDTDGVDPDGEFEAWRLRELARIKRDKEEQVRRDEEREEIERRRALPEEQRLREDLEHAQKLRDSKPKGSQKFLQKYWHKGAFHQDEEILRRHDYTEATESTVDVSMLPKVMQVKNFGKRSRTKYTHLLDQDTTAGNGGFGAVGSVKQGGTSTAGGGCFVCGGPHLKKDCPQNTGPLMSGANASAPAGGRSWGGPPRDPPGSWRERDGGERPRRQDDYRDRDRPRDGARDDSSQRSRSPRRREYSPRRRDYSPRRRDYSPRRRDYSPGRRDKGYEDRRPRERRRSRSAEPGREEKRRRLD
ncbi:microfibrillar-associated protein MFAP1, Zn finger, CCHC type protein [Schizophyllum fasciatum]